MCSLCKHRQTLKSTGILRNFALISLTTLLGLMWALLTPINRASSALSNQAASSQETVSTKVYAKSMIAIAVAPSLNFEIIPSLTSNFNYGLTDISITTNNRTGYSLYLHATDKEGKLRNRDSSVEATINPMPIPAKPDTSDFINNTWGYALNEVTLYQALPQDHQPIIHTESANTTETYQLKIGAKIDTTLPAGIYQGGVIISAVVNPLTLITLSDLDYMQEMTTEFCDNTDPGITKSLIDKRDNRAYTVTKLKDNNCWMTDNLSYSLSSQETLTPTDSDVTNNWKPSLDTKTALTNSVDQDGLNSWNIDNSWYYQWNTATAGSGQGITADGAEAPDSICPAGWKLPLGGTIYANINGSYEKLLSAYQLSNTSGAELSQPPLNFSKSGYITNSKLISLGTHGIYWTRVAAGSANSAYNLGFNAGGYGISGSIARFNGYTIRCVATGSD